MAGQVSPLSQAACRVRPPFEELLKSAVVGLRIVAKPGQLLESGSEAGIGLSTCVAEERAWARAARRCPGRVPQDRPRGPQGKSGGASRRGKRSRGGRRAAASRVACGVRGPGPHDRMTANAPSVARLALDEGGVTLKLGQVPVSAGGSDGAGDWHRAARTGEPDYSLIPSTEQLKDSDEATRLRWLEWRLWEAERRARGSQGASYVGMAVLGIVALASVVAGVIVGNLIFLAVSGTVFSWPRWNWSFGPRRTAGSSPNSFSSNAFMEYGHG
jgi:hypothetical protein